MKNTSNQRRNLFPELERQALVRLGHENLKSEEGNDVLSYLVEKRGIAKQVLDEFQVGYCPPRVDHELNGRIITPICDVYGDLVAISSRHFKHTKNFLHESFEKSFHLYGLHLAKKYILKYGKAVVVEGEFDVMFLHSSGIKIAVGLCGSAFSIFQLSLLGRYCNEIYVAFDGDDKRDKSVERFMKIYASLQCMEESGLLCFPVLLPLGHDPDDFVRKYGRNGFLELMKNSKARRSKDK